MESSMSDDQVDQDFQSLLAGLRTSLPGVQVLFAFLLTVPLQTSFAELERGSRIAFSIAFYASGLASVLLIAPSVHQRIRAPHTGIQRRSKLHLIIVTWLTIAGTVSMGIAIAATVYLVSSVAYDQTIASLAAAGLAAVLVWSWFFLPLITFRNRS